MARRATGRINYRIVTLFAALAGAILSELALLCLVTSLIKYRATDFFNATTTTDFVTLGTCVETLTHDQLKQLDYNNPSLDCGDDDEEGKKLKVINSLRATVHGVYWTYYNGQIDDPVANGTTVPANTFQGTHRRSEYLREVMTAQWAHVLGKVDAFYSAGAGGKQAQFVNVGLNFSKVYEALALVSEVVGGVPATCEEIYGMTYDQISDDHLTDVANSSNATRAAGGAATVDGIHHDTEHERYIKDIREGRLDDDETKISWPLRDFVINCPDEVSTPGVEHLPAGVDAHAGDVQPDLTHAQKKYMYAHCVAQFQFASVGTSAWEGTYGIPLPGIKPGPFLYPYPQVDGFNSTSSYTMRARMYLGQRFGLAVWAYVPMFLATVYLLGDCVVFFFAEALMPITLADQSNFETSRRSNARASLVLMATKQSSRQLRLAIGVVAVLVSIIFYSIFIAAPWGFFYTSLPRPICEKEPGPDAPIYDVGAGPDHGVPQVFWKGTKGGWRTDYDATWYDLMAIFLQLFVLVLLPLTTTGLCRGLNKAANGPSGDTADDAGAIQAEATRVQTSASYRITQGVLGLPLGLGIGIIIAGQSAAGARFGMAWAEGVVAQDWTPSPDGWKFDEVAISEHVYDQTFATLAATTACGLVFAVAMQRHLINGVGCFSAGLFFGWCALVAVFALPLIFYAMSRSVFSEDDANEDCAVFPRSSHQFENDLCVSRFWTFLVGGALFAGAVLAITLLGFLEAFPKAFAKRKATWMSIPASMGNDLARENAPFLQGAAKDVLFAPGLKPKTRATSSNQFLYGGKRSAPAPRR